MAQKYGYFEDLPDGSTIFGKGPSPEINADWTWFRIKGQGQESQELPVDPADVARIIVQKVRVPSEPPPGFPR